MRDIVLILERGGNLGNGTINTSKIVPVDSEYLTYERRKLSTPKIGIIGAKRLTTKSLNYDVKKDTVLNKRKKNRKRKHSDNFD